MHPEIEKTISMIDHQVTELQRARKILTEIFGEKGVQDISKTNPSLPFPGAPKITRRYAILKLFQEEAPLSRAEVVKKSGIPLGTVSTILNDKTTFRNKDGKWYLVEKKEQEPHNKKEEELKIVK